MYPFEYFRPDSIAEALDLYQASDDRQWLAGGMTLLPAMKLRLAAPGALVDDRGRKVGDLAPRRGRVQG